jgi:ectoine hydroxylase-related dioxygenase (phytanoyl-CoA dioxygenase family)
MSSPEFRALGKAPALASVLRVVLGGEPVGHIGDTCRLMSPGAVDLATPPHQDGAYVKAPEGVWVAWMPLGPCPLELGPLALAPGSHLGGILPHTIGEGAAVVPGLVVPAGTRWCASDLEEGDVLFFSTLALHKALPNRTADRLRVSADYRYRRGLCGPGVSAS